MNLIEDYSSGDELPIDIDGDPFPVPSLIENPDDGSRYLLVGESPYLPRRTWLKAYEAGAWALVTPHEGNWALLHADLFLEDRIEDPSRAGYELPAGVWTEYRGPLSMEDSELVDYSLHPAWPGPEPTPKHERFVPLHVHSEYSKLDGLSKIDELVTACVSDGQGALAITDHGNCASHPELQIACSAAGIKPVFGMEAYFQDDRFRRTKSWEETVEGKLVKMTDSREARFGYTHISLWAMNQVGLRNLWAMSTEAYLEGNFDDKPRLDWDTLTRLNEGVMASTGCLGGPLAEALRAGNDEKARIVLARLLDIFDDRLYIEIHTNSTEEQKKVNLASIELAEQFRIPIIACTDSHYPTPRDADAHRTWLAVNTGKDITEETGMFGGGGLYHMHTADEVAKALDYLPLDVVERSMTETVRLAARCTAEITGEPTAPRYSRGENAVADDERRLRAVCESAWQRKVIGKRIEESVYRERFEREMDLLIRKGFCGYFLIVWDYVSAAKKEGILVGPGRGSGGGSLVAYLADIVEIDPVDYDLMFERFLTEGRKDLPDFDIDFPASKRDWIKSYLTRRWGEDNVVTIGTIGRLRCKNAVNSALKALKPTLPYEPNYMDFKLFTKTVDAANAPLAGKQISWEDLWAQFDLVLSPLRAKYFEVFTAADSMVGRVNQFGKHPAGVVISTDVSLTDLPLRMGEDGLVVTQFDMDALAALGYVKFDLLTLRTLDTIQGTIDLIEERYGVRINPYDWRDELEDPQIWDQVSDGGTLGIFQVETPAGTRLTKTVRPQSVKDLAVVMTIVRPGPDRSGLKDIYLRRRAGEEEATVPDPRMESFLGPTFGCMIYQEQVMAACMELAGYDATEADAVRKILGKKLVEKAAAAGKEFIRRAIEHGTDRQVAHLLWSQMEEFAKYGFGKAHAFGYSVLGVWTAWLKFHFTVEFMTSALSTVDDNRIPEFIQESRRLGFEVYPLDINESQVKFVSQPSGIRYAISAMKGIDVAAIEVVKGQPYSSLEDFIDRVVSPKGSKVNRGHARDLVAVGAFDSLHPNRRALEQWLDFQTSGASTTCRFKDETVSGPNGLPCRFDWSVEPDPPMVKVPGEKGVFKSKPPPARCTVRCRQYAAPEPIDLTLVAPYTVDDIVARERELLGVWITASPFDRIPEEMRRGATAAYDIERGPSGEYLAIGIVSRAVQKVTRKNDDYAWVTLQTEDAELEAVCWPKYYRKLKPDLRPNALVVAVLNKDSGGIQLTEVVPV